MKKFLLTLICLICSLSMFSYDWEHISLSGGAEAIANYSWRGFAQGGLSVQPWLEFSAYGVTVGTWASVGSGTYDDFNHLVPEIDIYLSYTCPGDWATLMATHYYYFQGSKYFNFAYDKSLVEDPQSQTELELTIRPLMFMEENNQFEIGAGVMVGGGDYWSGNEEDISKDATTYEKLWSTYIYLKYTYEINNWIINPEIGFSPNKSMYTYYDANTGKWAKFALNNISCSVDYTFFENNIISCYALAAIRFNLYDVGYEKFAYGKNFGWNIGIGFEL